ncbi:MAG: hypothetical protein HYY93_00085, partial [Planctomycetes bacterium]|nr:hypothetical protein [Planctomycetota bacterium]
MLFAQGALHRTALDSLCALVQAKQNLPKRLHLRMPEFERADDAALEQGLHAAGGLSAADVNEALALRERLKSLGLSRSIGDVVVWRGWMREEQVEAILPGRAKPIPVPSPAGPAPRRRPTVGAAPPPELPGGTGGLPARAPGGLPARAPGQAAGAPPSTPAAPRLPSWLGPLVLTTAAVIAIVLIGRSLFQSSSIRQPEVVRPTPGPTVPARPAPPGPPEIEAAQRRVQEFLSRADFAGAHSEQKALVDRMLPGIARSAEEDRLAEMGEQFRAFEALLDAIRKAEGSPKSAPLGGDDFRVLSATKSSVILEGGDGRRRTIDWSKLPPADLCALLDAFAVSTKEPFGVAVYAVA